MDHKLNSSSSDLTRTIEQISKNWADLEKRFQPLKEIILQFNNVKSKQFQTDLLLPFQGFVKKMEKVTLRLLFLQKSFACFSSQ